ncbi:MAG: S9 family peptidase [Calditrichaeota bacterium]|nr:S9 family peptidase [Calditrichota bacterium]
MIPKRQSHRYFLFALFLFMLLATIFSPLKAIDKKPLTHDVYDTWKSIQRPQISPDGKWILYLETPQKGDAFLVVKNVDSGKTFRQLVGFSGDGTSAHTAAKPKFNYEATHVVFMISHSKAEVDSLKKAKKKSKKKKIKKMGILDLVSGEVVVVDSVKSFSLPEKNGSWLAYLKEAAKDTSKKKDKSKAKTEEKKSEEKNKKKKEKKDGTPLIVRSLKTGAETKFQHITDYRFTKKGDHLFVIISDKKKAGDDGVYDIGLGETVSAAQPILTGKGHYKKWATDKNETYLAFLTDRDDFEADTPTFNLYGWKIGDRTATLWVSHKETKNFPAGMAVSDKSGISFSKDGKIVTFGVKEIPAPEPEDSTETETAKFDLWHWNDPYPQPQQKKMAQRVRDNTWESVYFIKSKKFVKLADEKLPDVLLTPTGKIAYANNGWPYAKLVAYDGSYSDVYIVNPKNGSRKLIKQKLYGRASISPNAKYAYWFENGDWFAYNIKTNRTVNLTKGLGVRFDLEDWDTPNPARAYGIAGWTDGDKSILIYDHFDIWQVNPDGKNARCITESFGRKNNLSFRYVDLDREKDTVDPTKPMLLKTVNTETMASGFYRDKVNGNALPEKLFMSDAGLGRRIAKARNADRLMFTYSRFDQFPDLRISDLNFTIFKKVTDLGAQMKPYIWGYAELRNFLSADGKPLKGILIKPENFDANKKYPLMVYIYETLHDGLHNFRNPAPGTSINPSFYVSNGYLLWEPDIEYDTGYPGHDALKCVLPGIHMLIREGIVDPKRVGIAGHSWGGYQIAYMVTQTNIFAAAESGAPVSNMISSYDGIRWGTGMVRQFQYEKTQSRLGASLWEVPMRYIENSPIFWVDKIQTPLLIMHNDKDTAVPWYQGIEFIMALRRLKKEAYMFNYNGEPHGLRKRVNQEDWTKRMFQFFEHFLKDKPAPKWMTDGIKAWEKPAPKKK